MEEVTSWPASPSIRRHPSPLFRFNPRPIPSHHSPFTTVHSQHRIEPLSQDSRTESNRVK